MFLDVVRRRSRANKCKSSAIVFNATLASGYQSGKFVDHGDLGSMSVCRELCCQSYKCDVAFMAGNRCFSVHCGSQEQCQWIPAKDNKYLLQLSYISGVHTITNIGKSFNPMECHCHALLVPLVRGEGGCTQQSFIRGGSTPRFKPLPFYILFLIEKVHLSYAFQRRKCPFHIPCGGAVV